MTLSSIEQQHIQDAVDLATPDQYQQMKIDAENTLTMTNAMMGHKLANEEMKLAEMAIEVLVRLEAMENNKGWWFRTKRRVQLVQMYLGNQQLFGFLIRGEVNDDAVRLKALVDQVVAKYMSLTHEELMEVVPRDFPAELYHAVENDDVMNFTFPDVKEFLFMLHTSEGNNNSLTAIGRGKYAGFTLYTSDSPWFCSVEDGITYRATGGAKMLAKLMAKKFGISDMTKILAGY